MGVEISPSVVQGNPVKMGSHSYSGRIVNSYNSPINVGKFTSIATELEIIAGQHPPVEHPECVSTYPFHERESVCNNQIDYWPCMNGATINIGSDVWIGQYVTIIGSVNIGHGAIIGSKAVVTKDIPPYALAVGCPIVIKRFRFAPDIIDKLLKIAWWDWEYEEIVKAVPYMKDINKFLEYAEKRIL
jgi:acetyltransferase-like isoleucine patch superfamily enzyme